MKQVCALIAAIMLAPASLAAADCSPDCADADRDGVVDGVDQCADTEAGAPVTLTGCPHDSDGDGVPEHRDHCPGRAAASVDQWGCPLAIEIELEDVSFEVNSARLEASSLTGLDALVTRLNRYQGLVLEVAGHTDSRGSAAHNRRLSRLRAEAVLAHLQQAGLQAERAVARGYGESRPVADNDTESGRSRNRRVVLRILEGRLDAGAS